MHSDFQRAGIPIAMAVVECLALMLCTQTPAVAQSNTSVQDRQAIDRAEGEGDKVFKWILIHSDKPRKAAAAKEDIPPAASAKTASARVAKVRRRAQGDDTRQAGRRGIAGRC